MKMIKVNLGRRSYPIITGRGVIKQLGRQIRLLNLGTDAYIITNSSIKRRYGKAVGSSLVKEGINYSFRTIADTEKSKSLSNCLRIVQDLAKFDRRKRTVVVAFGGGVVGDLSGFAASIYKRGVPYVQVPTTLLACVDSSIGGKTGVDLRFGKNLAGAFYQPRLVVAELSFLKSLNSRQMRAGLSEVIKYAIIKDSSLFGYLEKNYRRLLSHNMTALEYVVKRCAQIKASIIGQDEREEKGIRTILNFGHTLGHAIESAGGYSRYNHGEAIALGMILAACISKRLELIDEAVLKRIEVLIERAGLPVFIEKLPMKKILGAYYRDKKFIGKVNRFVLIKDIGRTLIKDNLALGIIRDTLSGRMNPRI
ncbi:3-dehydroquinate synthase [Candidatus Omnitrophota bacterium]